MYIYKSREVKTFLTRFIKNTFLDLPQVERREHRTGIKGNVVSSYADPNNLQQTITYLTDLIQGINENDENQGDLYQLTTNAISLLNSGLVGAAQLPIELLLFNFRRRW